MSQRSPSNSRVRAGGFTLVEILVSLAIIAVLISLLIVGIQHALRIARGSNDASAQAGMSVSIGQFKSELGFIPPIVIDGQPLATSDTFGPILADDPQPGLSRIALLSEDFYDDTLADGTVITEPASGSYSDKRYSKLSLPYYLAGACGARNDIADQTSAPIDGVEGEGLKEPRRDGLFNPRGRTYEPFFSPSGDQLKIGYANENEYAEHAVAYPANPAQASNANKVVFLDSGGIAQRYYRWRNDEPLSSGAKLGSFMRIPKILQDPLTWSDPDASAGDDNTKLRSANYAIVGAGPNKLFGTESLAVLQKALGSSSTDLDALRHKAWADNIVHTGKE